MPPLIAATALRYACHAAITLCVGALFLSLICAAAFIDITPAPFFFAYAMR